MIDKIMDKIKGLSFDDFVEVERRMVGIKDAIRKADAQTKSSLSPYELVQSVVGDWGCFSKTPGDVLIPLNTAGAHLVLAIRDSDVGGVQKAMWNIRAYQKCSSRYGADDTEGCEILWELLRVACAGSIFNAEALWDAYYE